MCLRKNYIAIAVQKNRPLFWVFTRIGCCGYFANRHPVVKRGTSVTNATTQEAKYLQNQHSAGITETYI
jgi:hypothetical protein